MTERNLNRVVKHILMTGLKLGRNHNYFLGFTQQDISASFSRVSFEDEMTLALYCPCRKKYHINKKSKSTKLALRTSGWHLLIIFVLFNPVTLNKSLLMFLLCFYVHEGADLHSVNLTHTGDFAWLAQSTHPLMSQAPAQTQSEKHKSRTHKEH